MSRKVRKRKIYNQGFADRTKNTYSPGRTILITARKTAVASSVRVYTSLRARACSVLDEEFSFLARWSAILGTRMAAVDYLRIQQPALFRHKTIFRGTLWERRLFREYASRYLAERRFETKETKSQYLRQISEGVPWRSKRTYRRKRERKDATGPVGGRSQTSEESRRRGARHF